MSLSEPQNLNKRSPLWKLARQPIVAANVSAATCANVPARYKVLFRHAVAAIVLGGQPWSCENSL